MLANRAFHVAVVTLLAVGSPVVASDHTGIYAVIEHAELLPEGKLAERVRVRGIFSFAKDRRDYELPRSGTMEFSLVKGKEELCRNEWQDLLRVAGKGEIIAFARRYKPLGTITPPGKTPKKADEYPLHFGIRKMRPNASYEFIRRLAYFAAPQPLGDGALTDAGQVTLVARVIKTKADHSAMFVFEIENAEGQVERSEGVAAKEGKVRWQPKMVLAAGKTYKWRVRPIAKLSRDGRPREWKGPAATSEIRVP